MRFRSTHLAVATTCLLAACASTQDISSRHSRRDHAGAISDSTTHGNSTNDLRNTPALSSTASLPRIHGDTDATGSSRRIDALMSPDTTLPPNAPASGGAHPLVGVVPGSTWP
ncbi:hypothetical protein [Chthoniobacter flavus]|uniref:hypothetical protein n=1 Tax=Chthoniobacter flavus TaxID=191863 RepID=UPI0005B2A49F|nr:hypothetical protein [Chthoniobacter flavus]